MFTPKPGEFTATERLPPKVTGPAPRFSGLSPRKVKLPFHAIEMLAFVTTDPMVLSILPALIVNVPDPRAVALLIFNVPAPKVAPPEKVLAPLKVSAPAPALDKTPPPPTMPPSCKVLPLTVITVVPEGRVTLPVPRLNPNEPAYVKLPLTVTGLFVCKSWDSPLWLSSVPPDAMVSVPVPIAELPAVEPPLLITNV